MIHTARKDWHIMNCKNIIDRLEEIAPVSFAEDWDNVGLLVGSRKKEAKKIMVALDATDSVIAQASEQQVDMLITHHPMIFSSMKRVNDEDFIGRRIISLIQHDISYYAMHTNCDVCIMNDVAADKIELKPTAILEEIGEADGKSMGIGKVGTLPETISVQQLAAKVKAAFQISDVRVTGDLQKKVSRVAISTGAGKSMMKLALKKGAEVFITGDMDHHSVIDALDQGMQIIDAGHYGTEHFMVDYVASYLEKVFGSEIEVVKATEDNPFVVL